MCSIILGPNRVVIGTRHEPEHHSPAAGSPGRVLGRCVWIGRCRDGRGKEGNSAAGAGFPAGDIGGCGRGGGVGASAIGGLVVHLTSRSTSPAVISSAARCDAVALANAVLPSVVTINGRSANSASNGNGEFIRRRVHPDQRPRHLPRRGQWWFFHRVAQQRKIAPATLVGRAAALDLAMLKISSPDKTPAIAIDPDPVVVGQPVGRWVPRSVWPDR